MAALGKKGGFAFVWPIGEQRVIFQTLKIHDNGLRDLRPVWNFVIPNIRMYHWRTFRRQADPYTRKTWTPLSPKYAEQKEKKYPGKRILEATGRLRKAAGIARGGVPAEQINISKPRYMIWGVRLVGEIYHLIHQLTKRKRKDGASIQRIWFGVPARELGLSIQNAFRRVMEKALAGVGGIARGAALRKKV